MSHGPPRSYRRPYNPQDYREKGRDAYRASVLAPWRREQQQPEPQAPAPQVPVPSVKKPKKTKKPTRRAVKKQLTPPPSPTRQQPTALLKSGRRPSPIWEKIFLHFDALIADKGPYVSLNSISYAVERWLEDQNRRLDPRTISRGIKKNRPHWFKPTYAS